MVYTQERAAKMASSSNGHQTHTDGVDEIPDDFTLDLDQGLADTALRRRNGLEFCEQLAVPEYDDPLSPSTADASRVSATDLFQIPENEDQANTVPMQLLNGAEQEMADLLMVYPKARVQGKSITAFHYIVVVKRLKTDLMVSKHGIIETRHPEAHARLLLRLSRELKSVPTFESVNLSDEFSDPADYDGWLGELLSDMEEYVKTPEPSLPDGYVYVRRGTDSYVDFLHAAATRLRRAI